MYRKSFITKQIKSVSKQIRRKFNEVLNTLELEIRAQDINKQQQLEQMQSEIKGMAQKINQFSNLLLQDDFQFSSLQQNPLVMIRYCEIIFDMLIENFKSQNKDFMMNDIKKSYSQNNVYEVVASLKLQNFDLTQKIKDIEKQLQLNKKRAQITQDITQNIQTNTQKVLQQYRTNFKNMCDLLKKAETNEIELLQNNRFLRQELQSLSIQFERYKQYFKQGPTLKEKQFKIKTQLQKQYQQRLKNAIKQVQKSIKGQLQKSIIEKFHLNDLKGLRI